MTEQEKIAKRFELVSTLFLKTGDDLKQTILENLREESGPDADMRARVDVQDNELLGRKWYRIKSKKEPVPGKTKRILYLHGGGWVLETGPQQLGFAEYLADNSGAEVWFPEYPLSPEANAVDAHKMILELYKQMLQEVSAEEIAVMGDSAGGGLTVSAAMYFREVGLPQPNNLVLISPGIDLRIIRSEEEQAYLSLMRANHIPTMNPEAMTTIMEWWRGPLDENHYFVNPIMGDLRGLAPMTVFIGSGEAICVWRFAAKAAKQRVPVKYWEKLNAVHTWVTRADQENSEEREFLIDLLKNPVD